MTALSRLTVLLLAALTAAQGASITGRTVNSVTGAPVSRVLLTAEPADPAANLPRAFTTADASGAFSFTGLAAGAYRIRAERNGFLTTFQGAHTPQSPGAVVYLNDGQTIELRFAVIPQSVLAVKVFDEHGEPLNGATVQILRSIFTRGRRSTVAVASGLTNDLGEFRAPNLSAGSYYVTATPPPSIRPPDPREQGQLGDSLPGPTFFPSASDLAHAIPIQIRPGQETPATLTIARGASYTIRGSIPVLGPELSDLTGSRSFVVLPRQGTPALGVNRNPSGGIDANGGFELSGILPGFYVIALIGSPAASSVYAPRPLARADVVVEDRDVSGVNLAPVLLVTVRGRVRIEGEDEATFKGLRIAIAPLDPLPGADAIAYAATAPDGTFAIEGLGLLQGRYQFRPSPIAGAYLKQVRWSDQDVSDSVIDLLNTIAPLPLEFTYSRKPVTLEVIVDRPLDRDPGTVVIVPDPYRPSELPLPLHDAIVLTPDQDGFAVAHDLPPGSYRAFAFEHFDPTEDLDPAILESLGQWSARITLNEGQGGRVAVKWPPTPELY